MDHDEKWRFDIEFHYDNNPLEKCGGKNLGVKERKPDTFSNNDEMFAILIYL